MADQINSSSPTHSSDPKLDASESTKKRKNPSPAMATITKNLQLDRHQTGSNPPCKRPYNKDKQPMAKEEEEEEEEDIKDTATSNPKEIIDQEKEKEDESSIELPDIDVLEAIIRFHSRYGVYPFENSSTMRDFLSPWIRLGFGNPKQLKTKIENVKNKFKKDDVIDESGKLEEFELWMKIWGKNKDDEGGCS